MKISFFEKNNLKINLLRLFTREEPIAGLEVSNDYLRFVSLEKIKDKKTGKYFIQIKSLAEEPLKEKALTDDGKVENEEILVESLKNLIKKAGGKIKYIIASLPNDIVYSKIYNFPVSLSGKKLENAMGLIIDFQLPLNHRDVYFDWEKTSDSGKNEYLLSLARKTTVDKFIKSFDLAGLKTVAVEFHILSVLRPILLPKKENLLIKFPGEKSTTLFIVKNNALYFSRVLPKTFLSSKILDQEIKRVSDFYETEECPVNRVLDISEIKISPEFSKNHDIAKEKKWLISLGAAQRGLLPRSEDTFASLMPVGTEKAYEYQKMITFLGFLTSVIVGLSFFFSGAFLCAWLLMNYIHQSNLTPTISNIELGTPKEIAEIENRVKKLNALIDAESHLLKNTPQWSLVLEELKTKTPAGIYITSISITSPQNPIALAGIAPNRSQLNSFKKSLELSSLFSEVVLPLSNLEMRENIPFSISFKLKDPQSIYIK